MPSHSVNREWRVFISLARTSLADTAHRYPTHRGILVNLQRGDGPVGACGLTIRHFSDEVTAEKDESGIPNRNGNTERLGRQRTRAVRAEATRKAMSFGRRTRTLPALRIPVPIPYSGFVLFRGVSPETGPMAGLSLAQSP